MRKIFINENIEIFEGSDATPFLNQTNDLKFFNAEEQGIHQVSQERWRTAQKYEHLTWMIKNPSAKEDRNQEHFKRFNSFESVKKKLANKKSVIELGCGPFTNLKLILPLLKNPQHLALLDPLINDYINLEHCSYNQGIINDQKVTLINSTIEDFQPEKYSYEIPNKFDVVIMINVIEHCYSVNAIFNKILQILNKDGILIFSDVYFKNVFEIAANLYDAGHPLHLSEEKLNSFLENFKPLFEERIPGLYGQEWRNDIYFIGKL